MGIRNDRILNPWVSIWTRPRATIQQVIDSNPEQWVLGLVAVAGFSQALDRASARNMGDRMDLPMIYIMAAIFGPISGIIALYLGGALIRWTGKWIGGKAPIHHIRAAIAWSFVPRIWALILWTPGYFLFGHDLFTTDMPRIEASHSLTLLFMGYMAVEVTVIIWAIVIFIICLGQVQGFPAWKALVNIFLLFLVITVLIILPSIVIKGVSLLD